MRGAPIAARLGAAVPQAPAVPDLQFHHLHVRDLRPLWRIGFYERLFDPGVLREVAPLGEMRVAMIEGPDLIPIELVESPR